MKGKPILLQSSCHRAFAVYFPLLKYVFYLYKFWGRGAQKAAWLQTCMSLELICIIHRSRGFQCLSGSVWNSSCTGLAKWYLVILHGKICKQKLNVNGSKYLRNFVQNPRRVGFLKHCCSKSTCAHCDAVLTEGWHYIIDYTVLQKCHVCFFF